MKKIVMVVVVSIVMVGVVGFNSTAIAIPTAFKSVANEYVNGDKNVEVDVEEYSYADMLDDEAYAREQEAKQISKIDKRRKALSEKMATIDASTEEGKKAIAEISKEMMELASMRLSASDLIINVDNSISFEDYIDAVETYGVGAKITIASRVNKNDIINGDYPLHAAIKSGRFDEAIHMIEHLGADVNQVNDFGQTPLMLTMKYCKGRANNVATCLIDNGATITLEDVDSYGINAMFYAVLGMFNNTFTLQQSAWMIDFLVNNGANINAIGPNNMNLLMYTMVAGSKYNRMEDAAILIMNLVKRFPQLDLSYAIERNDGKRQKLIDFAIAYGYGDRDFMMAITKGIVNF